MLRNLLLDWSGTLVDDLPPVIGATNHVLEHFGKPPLTREEFRRHFRLPFTEFYEEFLPDVPLVELDALFHRRFVEIQDEVAPLPGLYEFLDFCRASGRRLFLLSSMKQEHFDVQSAKLGLRDYFEYPYAGILDKRAKIGEILATHGLAGAETAFVGDMIHDVETARHGGVMSIAVLTGYDSIEKLAPSKPDVVVSSLHELRRLLMHESHTRPVAAVGALITHHGKLLMIRTRKWSNKWGIPGGKIERGETAEEAVRREVR
jgi:phosphoglycolate phosphatase-like HAD superfamily hydrolase